MSDVERFPIYEEYVRLYGTSRADGGHAKRTGRGRAKSRRWLPRRCCYQDWILSAYVSRWSRTQYDVALFLAEDHTLLEQDSGVKGGLMFLLSDAYHHTGRMELTFVGPINGARPSVRTGYESDIPTSIKELGRKLGIAVEGQRLV